MSSKVVVPLWLDTHLICTCIVPSLHTSVDHNIDCGSLHMNQTASMDWLERNIDTFETFHPSRPPHTIEVRNSLIFVRRLRISTKPQSHKSYSKLVDPVPRIRSLENQTDPTNLTQPIIEELCMLSLSRGGNYSVPDVCFMHLQHITFSYFDTHIKLPSSKGNSSQCLTSEMPSGCWDMHFPDGK